MLKGLLNDKTGKGGAEFMKKKKIKKQFTDQTSLSARELPDKGFVLFSPKCNEAFCQECGCTSHCHENCRKDI